MILGEKCIVQCFQILNNKNHLLENTDFILKPDRFGLESPKGGAQESVILTKAYAY